MVASVPARQRAARLHSSRPQKERRTGEMGIGWSAILMLMLGGNPTELLQVVPTEMFWKIEAVEISPESMLAELTAPKPGDVSAWVGDLKSEKYEVRQAAQRKLLAAGPAALEALKPLAGSKDPELAARAGKIIEQLSARARHRGIRRLMAIRTLGELKAAKALPVLKRLTESRELFVADYARAAVAAVEGEAYQRPALAAKERMTDLRLLPKGCGVVAQFSMMPGGGKLDLAKMLASMGPMAGDRPPEQILEQALKEGILPIAYEVGNFRLRCVTIGLSGEVGDDRGWFVAVVRGLYDAQRAAAALRRVTRREREGRIEKVGKLEIFCPDNELALILPSNDRFIFMAGAGRKELPVAEIVSALGSGKGSLLEDKDMAALIASADTSAPVWGVAKMTPWYRKASVLEPFQTMALVGKHEKGALHLALTAKGGDAEKVEATRVEAEQGLMKARNELERIVPLMPAMQPMAELLRSVQMIQRGSEVKVTATLSGGALWAPALLWSFTPAARSAVKEEAAVEAGAPAIQRTRPDPVPQ
jgi:hypothetical protein